MGSRERLSAHEVASHSASNRRFSVGVVILAAGNSSRMGRPKLLLPWANTSVLGHLIRRWKALGTRQICVVCAADNARVEAELDRLGFPSANRILNPAPERGMFSSIKCAARWPGWRRGITHWAIVLGDQPHLRARTLRRVLEFSAAHAGFISQPARRGHGRHPVLLPRAVLRQVGSAAAKTLKAFLAGRTHQVALCELDDAGLDLDIDRPGDYQRAIRFVRRGARSQARRKEVQ